MSDTPAHRVVAEQPRPADRTTVTSPPRKVLTVRKAATTNEKEARDGAPQS